MAGSKSGRFLIRRGFKIYPSFYVFLVVAGLAAHFFARNMTSTVVEYLHEIFFVQNYFSGVWGHTWSLAVEEHFYLLLPIFLVTFGVRAVPRAFPIIAVISIVSRGLFLLLPRRMFSSRFLWCHQFANGCAFLRSAAGIPSTTSRRLVGELCSEVETGDCVDLGAVPFRRLVLASGNGFIRHFWLYADLSRLRGVLVLCLYVWRKFPGCLVRWLSWASTPTLSIFGMCPFRFGVQLS